MRRRLLIAFPPALAAAALTPAAPARAAEAWDELRAGRAAALLRHALAPGTGDPPGFRLESCATQRTLSEAGREQARRIGDALRTRGLTAASVLSSAWCRCRETAELLGLGPVRHEPALDSFFADRGRATAQTEALRALLRDWAAGALVLVTHQVNIAALTGLVPASGEAVLVRTGAEAGAVLSRLAAPAA